MIDVAPALACAACNSCDKAKPVEQREPAPAVVKTLADTHEADVALQAGKVDEAIAKAEAASQADPGNALAANLLGRAEAAKFDQSHDDADAQKAFLAFKRAVADDARFWPAHFCW